MEDDDIKLEMAAYKIMAESAERTSDRRQAANSAFLAINAGIGGIYAFLLKGGDREVLGAICWFGLLACVLWAASLSYYRSLSAAKYALLGEFEERLGFPGYHKEWEMFAKTNPMGRAGLSLSSIELTIAGLAFLGHLGVLLIFAIFGYRLAPIG